MHLNAKRPIFVPARHQDEIEKMSKAALMDLVWDFAITGVGVEDDDAVMSEFRRRRDIILAHRK